MLNGFLPVSRDERQSRTSSRCSARPRSSTIRQQRSSLAPVRLDPADGDQFRSALARYATGVVVVSVNAEGIDHAMTANSFTSVSLSPPLVLVCVERDSRFHSAVLGAEGWGVSILTDASRAAALWFATRGRPLAGQFEGYEVIRGEHTGALLLKHALGRLECRTEAIHPGGDHDILVGRVVGLQRPVSADDAGPLVYFRHGFGTVAPE